MNEDKCSCNKRPKHKCVKESDSGYGKMCFKEEQTTDFNNMTDEEFERMCVEQLKSYYKEYDVVEKVLEIFWEKENEANKETNTPKLD